MLNIKQKIKQKNKNKDHRDWKQGSIPREDYKWLVLLGHLSHNIELGGMVVLNGEVEE